MYLAWGQVLLGGWLDPANEAGSSITIDEDFNTDLDNFLGSKD